MAHTTSRLSAKLSTEAVNNDGIPWSAREAQTELLIGALGFAPGVTPTGTYTSTTFSTGGVAGQIPAGVLSWSFTCISGTAVCNGGNMGPGYTFKGGGYNGMTMKTLIPWTLNGVAVITWDLVS